MRKRTKKFLLKALELLIAGVVQVLTAYLITKIG